MTTQARIISILEAQALDSSVTGFPTFYLADLNLPIIPNFYIPTNIRLGHIAEKVVAQLICSSTNFKILYENLQIIEDKNTIGEIDFIIQEATTGEIIHLELAYKFFLFDPTIAKAEVKNWIGPNRNDSLIEKLEKLKTKQFPLLHNSNVKTILKDLNIPTVRQSLCLLASLYIPFDYNLALNSSYQKAVKGYYLSFEKFITLENKDKSYYLPDKKEWGIDPGANQEWNTYEEIRNHLTKCMAEKQAVLCWQKTDAIYSEFFIVWW